MTNYEYIMQSKGNLARLIEKVVEKGVCATCTMNECLEHSCEVGHKMWLDEEYDKDFWREEEI